MIEIRIPQKWEIGPAFFMAGLNFLAIVSVAGGVWFKMQSDIAVGREQLVELKHIVAAIQEVEQSQALSLVELKTNMENVKDTVKRIEARAR